MMIPGLARQAAFGSAVLMLALLMQPMARAQDATSSDGSTQHLVRSAISESSTRSVSAMVNDGIQMLSMNRNEEAAVLLKKAVELYPSSAEAHHSLGLALAKLGASDKAIQELETARSLDPSLYSSWLTLAGLHQSLGHMDQAIALYTGFLNNPAFQRRPDLQDTMKTVKSLLEGLRGEHSGMMAAEEGAMALHQPTGSLHRSLLQVPASGPDGTDDYLAESTRSGIMFWPQSSMPIKVYIAAADNVPGYHKAWREILIRSFADWSTASAGLVRFQMVPRREQANIQCDFVADGPGSQSTDNNAEAGEAKMFMDANGLSSGTIQILTKSLSSVLPLTDNRIRLICLHEIGHALGLAGHTLNPGDIMFYSTSFKDEWRDLTGRDARTIQRLYSIHE